MNTNEGCENCNCPVRGGLLTMVLSVVALVLFVINAALVFDAQATQRELAARQTQIQEGMALSQLNQQLVQALGAAQIQNKDKKIEALLGQHGITVQQEQQQKRGQ